jgi:UDP-N-acetylglucosamine 4,6-dehydratase
MDLSGKTILVTGGTGSFGTRFIQRILQEHDPQALRVFSRDELKQYELQRRIGDDPRLRMLIGDVRDLPRLVRATRGVDVIIHAAAMKQVPACEYNRPRPSRPTSSAPRTSSPPRSRTTCR